MPSRQHVSGGLLGRTGAEGPAEEGRVEHGRGGDIMHAGSSAPLVFKAPLPVNCASSSCCSPAPRRPPLSSSRLPLPQWAASWIATSRRRCSTSWAASSTGGGWVRGGWRGGAQAGRGGMPCDLHGGTDLVAGMRLHNRCIGSLRATPQHTAAVPPWTAESGCTDPSPDHTTHPPTTPPHPAPTPPAAPPSTA